MAGDANKMRGFFASLRMTRYLELRAFSRYLELRAFSKCLDRRTMTNIWIDGRFKYLERWAFQKRWALGSMV